MSLSRRQFLQAMLAAGAAPAIVKAENLMKIWVPPEKEIVQSGWADLGPGGPSIGDWRFDHALKEIQYVGPPDGRVYTVNELYELVKKEMDRPENMTYPMPMLGITPNLAHMDQGYDINADAVKHLRDGTLITPNATYSSFDSRGKV